MKKTFIARAIGGSSALLLSAVPMLAAAQGTPGSGIVGLINLADSIINKVIPFIIALTVLVFLWGIFQFVVATDAEKRKEAREYMIWGIVALFVMVSVWGIVNILVSTIFPGVSNTPLPPPIYPY